MLHVFLEKEHKNHIFSYRQERNDFSRENNQMVHCAYIIMFLLK